MKGVQFLRCVHRIVESEIGFDIVGGGEVMSSYLCGLRCAMTKLFNASGIPGELVGYRIKGLSSILVGLACYGEVLGSVSCGPTGYVYAGILVEMMNQDALLRVRSLRRCGVVCRGVCLTASKRTRELSETCSGARRVVYAAEVLGDSRSCRQQGRLLRRPSWHWR